MFSDFYRGKVQITKDKEAKVVTYVLHGYGELVVDVMGRYMFMCGKFVSGEISKKKKYYYNKFYLECNALYTISYRGESVGTAMTGYFKKYIMKANESEVLVFEGSYLDGFEEGPGVLHYHSLRLEGDFYRNSANGYLACRKGRVTGGDVTLLEGDFDKIHGPPENGLNLVLHQGSDYYVFDAASLIFKGDIVPDYWKYHPGARFRRGEFYDGALIHSGEFRRDELYNGMILRSDEPIVEVIAGKHHSVQASSTDSPQRYSEMRY